MEKRQMNTNRIFVLIGGLILVIGSRLPWMSVPILFGVEGPAFEAIEAGWEDNGIITGGIGLVLLFGGLFWKGKTGTRYTIPGAILAALAIAVVMGCFWRIVEIDPEAGFFAATDVGIYVTLTGAFLALVGALWNIPVHREKRSIASLFT